MKTAVMQPYIFPYIGYFQLINAVDFFVIYDDVNFIKGGWVNRNRILINGKDSFLTIPCINKSPNKLIKDVNVNVNAKEFKNLLKTITLAYHKAKYFNDVYPLIEHIFETKEISIADLAIKSIKYICNYLGIKTEIKISSVDFHDSKDQGRVERLITICETLNSENYINAIGGVDLYQKEIFHQKGVKLNFLRTDQIKYDQFQNEFIPWLSIIDILMFNSKEEIVDMLNQYDFV